MKISDEDVFKVAELSSISICPEEVSKIRSELEKIFGFIDQLNEVNCDNIEPLSNVSISKMPEREDVVTDGGCVDAILSNAPEKAANMFVVPKVID